MIARLRLVRAVAIALLLGCAAAQRTHAPSALVRTASRSWQQQALHSARARLRALNAELQLAKQQAPCIRRRSQLLRVLHKRKRESACRSAPPRHSAAQLCAQLRALWNSVARAKRGCSHKWKACWKRAVQPLADRLWKARQACACEQRERIVRQIGSTRRMCKQSRSETLIANDIAKLQRRLRYLLAQLKPKPSVAPRRQW